MDAPVRPGDILAQKYRVDRVLGVGGMGVVVAATHIELEQRVAVKFMLDEAFTNAEARSRFLREARAVVKLRSEHVARVLDTGTLESGAPYIVMEYLEGTDLAATLQSYGPLPLLLVTECLVQACDALAEAHAQGIVHRDLKPANLFMTQRSDGAPLVKVLDFGISKVNALNDKSVAMTKTSALMGSPLYMSPEQMRSAKDVDQRTDVWSLGVVLYEMLCGRVPFMSDSLGELLYTVMTLPHPPLAAMTDRQDIPPDVAALVDWCLQKDPAQRAPNVAEIARRLAPYSPPRVLATVERISSVLRASPPVGFQGAITNSGLHSAPRLSSAGISGSFPAVSGSLQPRPPSLSQQVQGLPPPSTASAGVHAPVPHAQTSAGWSGTSPGRARSRSMIPVAVGAAVLTSALGFAGFLIVHNLGGAGAHAAVSPAAASSAPIALEPAGVPAAPGLVSSVPGCARGGPPAATTAGTQTPSAQVAAQPDAVSPAAAASAPASSPAATAAAAVAPAHPHGTPRGAAAAHATSSQGEGRGGVPTSAAARVPSGGIPESSR